MANRRSSAGWRRRPTPCVSSHDHGPTWAAGKRRCAQGGGCKLNCDRSIRGPECLALVPRIVFRVHVFKAKRSNRRHLRDVLPGFCPVEVGGIARQDNHATWWIRPNLIAVELISQADVENAGNDCVDSVLRMSVRHQLHARWHFDSDDVRSWTTRLSNEHG